MAKTKTVPAERLTCTCALLRRASRQLTSLYDEALTPTGLRLSQYSLLAVVAREAPLTLNVLAQRLDMDRTTLTRNLKPLERAGWIKRMEGNDRRSRRIALTQRGASKLAAARPYWSKAEVAFRKKIGSRDVTGLHEIVETVLTILRDPEPTS